MKTFVTILGGFGLFLLTTLPALAVEPAATSALETTTVCTGKIEGFAFTIERGAPKNLIHTAYTVRFCSTGRDCTPKNGAVASKDTPASDWYFEVGSDSGTSEAQIRLYLKAVAEICVIDLKV